MKFNSLNESEGVVTKESSLWIGLCKVINEYIWDFNPKYNSDRISLSDIEGYVEDHDIELSIPNWILDFTINVEEDDAAKAKGSFVRANSSLENDKLKFEIRIYIGNKHNMLNTLVHEFRHAYDYYIKLSRNLVAPDEYTKKKLYVLSQKGFDNKRERFDLVSGYSADFIAINESIFDDPTKLSSTLLLIMYYSDMGEVKSYLLEYHQEMESIIESNKKNIIRDIKQLRHEVNFNKTYLGNILDNISVTPKLNRFYRIYKACLEILLRLQHIDIDILYVTYGTIKREITTLLKLPYYKKLINDDSDVSKITSGIVKNLGPTIDYAILKMDRIFAKLIIKFEEENAI